MNYAWIAYEKGLHHLLQHFPQNHSEYDKVCMLQKYLQENITHAKSQGDTEVLREERKQIIAYLENTSKPVMEDGFMALCRAHCALFHYIAYVYEAASDASNVFRGDRIWPDQCQRIVDDFEKRPTLAEIEREVTNGTRTALYYIDERMTRFIQLVEEYERNSKLSNRRIRNKQEEVIRRLDSLIEEMQQIDNESFRELIEWYQEVICSANLPQTSPAADLLIYDTQQTVLGETYLPDQDLAQPSPPKHKEEPVHKGTYQGREEPIQEEFSQDEIDQAALREGIVEVFSLEELRHLCADVTQELHNHHIQELITLDILPGEGLRGKAQSLIEHLHRRSYLPFLIQVLRVSRPFRKW